MLLESPKLTLALCSTMPESWKPIYFGVKRSTVKATNHKNCVHAGVGLFWCQFLHFGLTYHPSLKRLPLDSPLCSSITPFLLLFHSRLKIHMFHKSYPVVSLLPLELLSWTIARTVSSELLGFYGHRRQGHYILPLFCYFVSIDERPAIGSQPKLASRSEVLSIYKCPKTFWGPPQIWAQKHRIFGQFFGTSALDTAYYVNDWNRLSSYVVEAPSVNVFQNRLDG